MSVSQREATARAWVLAQPVVDAFISSAVRNHTDAQDILQDVAVTVFDGQSLPPAGTTLTAWAIGIARHKVADHFRRSKRLPAIMDDEVLIAVAGAFSTRVQEWTEESHALEQCLTRVTGDPKLLLDLRYRDGFSPQEMADKLGRTSEAIRASLLRVRRSLRECIERRLSQPQPTFPSGVE